jgi:hypothetical protein
MAAAVRPLAARDRARARGGRCLHFSLDELRYEYPRRSYPDGMTPQGISSG